MHSIKRNIRHAFSLVELMVVVGVIGLLISLALPAIQKVRASAARLTCLSNLRQIGMSLHNYHVDFGRLPLMSLSNQDLLYSRNPEAIVSWRVSLLPYLDQSNLWRDTVNACQITNETWRNPPHIGLIAMPKVFACPTDDRLEAPNVYMYPGPIPVTVCFSSYFGVGGGGLWDGVMGMKGTASRFANITDGMSNTLMVGERPPPNTFESGQWYIRGWSIDESLTMRNANIPGETCTGIMHYGIGKVTNRCDQYHFWSLHPKGANFLIADGSARFIPYEAVNIMHELATKSGGEPVALPD
ncbi:MAG: DUF1559 domain-containing protein [Gemmatales bacterium]